MVLRTVNGVFAVTPAFMALQLQGVGTNWMTMYVLARGVLSCAWIRHRVVGSCSGAAADCATIRSSKSFATPARGRTIEFPPHTHARARAHKDNRATSEVRYT